jgi:N-hydroxyarylamine O-acetyltransferase
MTQSIYHRYLDALRISKSKPSFAALTKIIKAHLMYIPFENISKIYYLRNFDIKSIPDFELYVDGITKYNFGGTCYSNNYYLNKLLKYLGYNVRLCGADMSNPDVHIVNIVEINHREYLVDVGYAAPFYYPKPLDLSKNYELVFGRDKYILKPKDKRNYSELQLIRDGRNKHGYIVKPHSRSITEFERVIEDSMKSTATFLNAVLLVKYGENSSVVIHNLSLIEIEDSNAIRVQFKDKDELVDQIYLKFSISKDITRKSLSVIKNFNDAWN